MTLLLVIPEKGKRKMSFAKDPGADVPKDVRDLWKSQTQ